VKEDHARNSESLALTPYIYPSLPQQVDYLRCKKCAVWHWYNIYNVVRTVTGAQESRYLGIQESGRPVDTRTMHLFCT